MNDHVTQEEKAIAALQTDVIYRTESLKLQVAESIVALMDEHKLNKSALAEKLEKSASFVTKILSGENNFTLETMVRVGLALNHQIEVMFRPLNYAPKYHDYVAGTWVSNTPCRPATIKSSQEQYDDQHCSAAIAA